MHRRFFACPVQFDSLFDGFEFPAADLDRVKGNVDTTLASYAANLLDSLPGQDRDAVVTMVVRLIHMLLPMGRASIENVARAMGRNVRALQRELAGQGLEFRSMLAEVRDELALAYLQDRSLTVEVIAERLGYASATAFGRAFRQRQGVPPGLARDQR